MDALGLTAAEVGDALGLTAQTVRQMRLDPDNPNYRNPPQNWQTVLAAVARGRGKEMSKIAAQLEREA